MDTSSECPICFTEFTHPKQLPCVHSFCLKCLIKYCDENTEGDVVSCPLCRREFRIPAGGVKNLQDYVDIPQYSQNREAMKLYLGDNEHITMDSRADNCVKGITVVDDKIYVIRFWQKDSQRSLQFVYVYNIKNLKSPSHYIPLPEAKTAMQSIAGCVDKNCLYVVEGSRACIHRVDLNDDFAVSVIKLQEFQDRYEICSVPVTSPEHNILLVLKKVTEIDSDSILAECSSSGDKIFNKIVFDNSPTICYIRYALKIEDKIFVCHGNHSCQKRESRKCKQNICQHRIVRLNLKGDMEVLYGGHSGNGEDQLRWPRQFTVDYASKLIFLADNYNNRILLLNFDLKCLGKVKVPGDFKEPTRVCFDSATKRLFVGEYCGNGVKNGRLSVINFGSKILQQK